MRSMLWLPLTLCALSACGRATAPTQRLWSVAVPAPPGALSAAFASSADDVNLAALTATSLTEVRVNPTGITIEPALLQAWTWSEDGRVLTATLREGLSWEDGRPVLAADVAYAFAVVLDEASRSPRRALFADLQGVPAAPDERTVVWTYRAPGDPDVRLAALSALPPMPSHRLAEVPFAELGSHSDVLRPLSSGAFTIEVDGPEGARLRARTPSPGGVEAVLVRVVPDAVARRAAFVAGELDVLHGLTRDDLDAVRSLEDVDRIDRGPRTLEAIVLNVEDPVLADPRVRTALRQTADVARWATHLVAPVGEDAIAQPAQTPFPPWQLPLPATFPSAATDDAAAALDALGWTRSLPDGARARNGEPLRLRLLVNAENVRRVAVATEWQSDLAAMGIALTVESVPLAAFKERMSSSSFQLAFHGFGVPIVANPAPAWSSPSDRSRRGANVTGLHDQAVDAAIQAFEAAEPGQRTAALSSVAAAIDASAPFIPLWWLHEWVAVGARVGTAHPDIVSPWRDLQTWTYEAAP